VAATIVKLAQKPRREVYVGGAGRLISFLQIFAPLLAEPMLARLIDKFHFKPEPALPTSGDVLTPMPTGTAVNGGWKTVSDTPSTGLVAAGVATIASGLLAWIWLRNREGASSTGENS
jgi:hypothetical protein